ncbi:MAG: hypothetical protein ABW065_14725 [Solirubrobacterales bacterium]
MPRTRLHVVYAGRGDALIVEDETERGEKRLYMVDGGPLGYTPKRRSGAPYWLYYCSALAEVSQGMNRPADRLAPDGIVVSHAHEDHYGGIEGVFDRFLSPTDQPEPGKVLDFQEPLVTQRMRQGDPEVQGLASLLTRFDFREDQNPDPNLPLFQAFAMSAHEVFARPGAVLPARDWSVDHSLANRASVLMGHHRTGMLLTGDSVGFLILEFLAARDPGFQLPLFKVPHHGSLRNSQRGIALARVPGVAWRLHALLCIGSAQGDWHDLQMPAKLQQPIGAALRAREILERACGADFDDFIVELKEAFDETLSKIKYEEEDPFDYPAALENNIFARWKLVQTDLNVVPRLRSITRAAKKAAKRIRLDPQAAPPVDHSWFAKAAPGAFREAFLGAFAVRELTRFFEALNARNHVLSANRTHRHPSAETLAGMALADIPARALLTDGYAADLSRLGELAPDWEDTLEIRHLAKGSRMALDADHPDPIEAFDSNGSTKKTEVDFTLRELHQQFERNRGATIPPRILHDARFRVRAKDQPGLFLNLDGNGNFRVTNSTQDFYVDQAWTLSFANPWTLAVPSSFDDVQFRAADFPFTPARVLTLFRPSDGDRQASLLSVRPGFQQDRQYVCAQPPFLTTDPDEALAFEFVPIGAGAEEIRAEEPGEVPLKDFLTAVGVPTDKPLSAAAALPQLVGPENSADLDEGILSRLIQRAIGWNASLDKSTVSYVEGPLGPLVTAAKLEIEPGENPKFSIDDQAETVASAGMTLERSADSGALSIAAEVATEDGTHVWDGAEDPDPSDWRLLDQYLFELGMDSAARPNLTLGTLLTAMVGEEPTAEALLMSAPAPLLVAGLAEWTLDHAASMVKTQLTSTGGYVEIRAARLALAAPGAVADEAEGFAFTLSDFVLEVEDARLPGVALAIEATASAGGTAMEARAELEGEDCLLTLAPLSGGLAELLALLPAKAAGVAAMTVPLADGPLGVLQPSAPFVEVGQPSLGAGPRELEAVGTAIELPGWERALPSRWPRPGVAATATARVLDPLDEERRALALEVSFATPIGSIAVDSLLRAEPLPAPADKPAWSYTVSAFPDPAEHFLTAAEALGAVGLGVAADLLAEQLPALKGQLGGLAASLLTVTLGSPEGEFDPFRIDLGLVGIDTWKLLPGVVEPGLAQVSLIYEDGLWSAKVEGEARIGKGNEVAFSSHLPTASVGGDVSFENAGDDLTVEALADLCGLGGLGSVPVLGDLVRCPVDEVEMLLPQVPGSGISGVGFAFGAEPIEAGVFDLDWVGVEAVRRHREDDPGFATAFWLEGQWQRDVVVSLLYGDANPERAGTLRGELRPLATVELGRVLTGLLKEKAESTLMPAVAKLAMRGGESEQRTRDFALNSFRIALAEAAALPVAEASAGELAARWVAAHEDEKTKEEVPEVYALDGRLTRKGCKYEAALESQFRGEEKAKTVAGTIRALPTHEGESEEEKEAKKFTVATLLELLDLERPQVLTPKEAPEFFELEPTSVEATFSVEPFRLEALTIVVRTDKALSLLAAPQRIELEHLTLRIDYVREPKPGEAKIRGVVLGDLPLQPKAVTLAYTESKGEQAAFRAKVELKEEEAPDYRRLIGGEPYEPGYGVPDEPGLPAAIPMTNLTATARPGEYVELSGYDPRTSWELPVDRLTLKLGALGGRVRVAPGDGQDAPHRFDLALFGRLEYHGFVDGEALFTWGPEKPSLLTAEASEKAVDIDLAAIAAGLGSPWEDLVPAGTPAFSFTGAWTYVDLTDPRAISLDLYGDGSLGTVSGPAALRSQPVAEARRNELLFGAVSSGTFPLTPLWKALGERVDGYLSLAAGNLAALNEADPLTALEDDLAALGAAAKQQQAQYTAPFATLPPLAQTLPAGTELGAALTLVAKLDTAGEGKLSCALARIAEAGSLGTRLAWGPIEHGEPERSRLEVDLRGLVLLGGGINVEAVAEYVPSQAETLIAAGTVARVEIGAGSYDFSGRLVIGVEEASFATGEERAPIPVPLGATGADFRNPKLTAVYRYPAGQPIGERLRITAFVNLTVAEDGGEKSVTCDGTIEFSDGKAAVAVFPVPQAIQATDVYLNRMTGGSWPAQYPSFELQGPCFHAAPRTVEIDGNEYEAGYHVVATAPFFAHPFPFDLTIEAAGLKGGGASDSPVDLVYVELTGPAVTVATGPSPAFALGGGARVFKGDFGDTEFRFDPTRGEWTAAATYGGELVGVDEPETHFAYADATGLRLLSWPVKPTLDEEDEFDWEEELEEASEDSKCGKLEDLGLDEGENENKTIETEFDLTMEQVGQIAGEALTLSLRGTYTVIVRSSDGEETKTTMAFPPTQGTIADAGSFALEDLEGWVKETIEANHEALGKSLLDDRDSDGEPGLESFLEAFDWDEAEAELLERILCREDGPEKVRKATEKKLKETAEQTGEKEKEAKGQLEEVTTATTISLAFGFLITFFAWFGIAFGWVTGVCGLLSTTWWWLPLPLREEWEELGKKLEKTKEEGEKTQVWAETELLKMRGDLTVAFTDLTTVEVSWDDDNLPAYPGMNYEGFAGFSFHVEVAIDPQFEDVVGAATVDSPAAAASVAAASLGQSNYAFARMRPTFKGYPGTWISGRAFHLVPLSAPAPVSQALNATAEKVDVTLTTVPGALSYDIQLLDTRTAAVVAEATLAAPGPQPPELRCALAPTEFGSEPLLLLGRAKAIGDPALNEDSPFADCPEAETIPTVGPPRDVAVNLIPDGVQVTWEPVAGATVSAEVRSKGGGPLSPQPDSRPIPNGCVLSGPGIGDGAELEVVTRAQAPGALQPWSAPVPFTVRALPAPQSFAALYLSPEYAIRALWNQVSGAEGYEVELLDSSGERLEPTVQPQPWGALLTGAGIEPGKFSLRARATAPERVSTWTAWLPLVAEALPAPTGLVLSYELAAIWARWETLPGARYWCGVEGANGSKTEGEGLVPPAGFGPPAGLVLEAGARYRVQLRARVGDSLSAPATAELTLPTLLEIAERGWAGDRPVEPLAAECLALEAKLGPTQLTYTLLGGGYSSAAATAGVHAALPNTTPAEMAAIGAALLNRGSAIGRLQAEEVSPAVIVALCHALYSPVPLQLAMLLKQLGFAGTGLAPAFAAAFAMPLAKAEELITAVFGEPWRFGAVAVREGATLPQTLGLLRAAWPEVNKVAVKLLAALKGASSSEAEVRMLFGIPPFGFFPLFTVPWQAVHSMANGVGLAGLLLNSGAGREEASRCVAACWPQLTPTQLAEAIELAYGPPGPGKDASP